MTFSKILIANRGEIAVRIIRACKELGIPSVAVYSEADAESLHLKLAEERVCIGPAMSAKSYLNMGNIITAAKDTGAEAIHPGYGYLAENEEMAQECEAQGIVFIGPTPENLRLAGDKIRAQKVMKEAGVPVIPSTGDAVGTVEEAISASGEIGYPVMIKASGGGGGRGIRICDNEEMLLEEFSVAKMEARAAFGNDQVYIEKVLTEPIPDSGGQSGPCDPSRRTRVHHPEAISETH
jgi:acetyl-CoA carboxylase biotin carboxylase subunit